MIANIILILNLIILEGLLSIDNAAVLAIMVKDLPHNDSKKALRYGLLGAYLLRGLCLVFASYLIHVWALKMLGGFYLLYLTCGFFGKDAETIEKPKSKYDSGIYKWLAKAGFSQLFSTIILVEIMDLAFSIDNIFAAVAISNNYWIIITGVFMGIASMRFIAGWFIDLLNKYPSLEKSAFIVIGFLALKLILSGTASGLNIKYLIAIFENHSTDIIFSLLLITIFFIPLIKLPKRFFMTTLVWIFLILSCLVSGYISHKTTAWYYKRKIKHLTK